MGGIIAFLKVYLEGDPVNVFTIGENGRKMPWLRYVGWLITCPVLLIHLGNLTGEANFNIMRLMKMLVGLQLMVVSASTATVLDSGIRWLFYFTGWCSMGLVFTQAFDVFYEAQSIFPAKAKKHVSVMAFTFYSSWVLFAFAWFLSPHGIHAINTDFTNFLMAVADVPSKTIWGLLGWYLRWNILRKADGTLNEKTAKALEVEIKAKVCIVDNDMTMAHYLLGKLISMNYEPVIASNPDEMHSILENGEADVIFMEYGVAEAGDFALPRDIFFTYRLPVVSYGYDIPVNTFFLRSKHITDSIYGLPTDEYIDAVIERWAPVPGMEEETYASRRPLKKAAEAPAETPAVVRTPSFTEKAAMVFSGARHPTAPPPAPAPAPAPAAKRSGSRASPRGSGNNSAGQMSGDSGRLSPRRGTVSGAFPRSQSTSGDQNFNSMELGSNRTSYNHSVQQPQQGFVTSAQQQQQQQQQQPPVQAQEVRVQMDLDMPNPAPAQAPHSAAGQPVAPSEAEGAKSLAKLQSKIQDVELQLKHLRALSLNKSNAPQ